jgi:hypothetical protein
MRWSYLKAILNTVSPLGIIVLFCLAAAHAQVTVNLTAARETVLMPDGTTVPMWGWTCTNNIGNGTTATTGVPGGGTCSTLTGAVQVGGAAWQPPLITVPTGTGLTINLTNNLPVETSLVIVGQFGSGTSSAGGLGQPVRESGPRADGAHGGQATTTWVAQTPAGVPFTPPSQIARVRSFVPEAAALGGTQSYTWAGYNASTGQGLKPGTYLIETGTYPSIQAPMGLYGVLVVTTAPSAGTAGTAYSGSVLTAPPSTTKSYSIQYDADVPLLLSEIDPIQNGAVEKLVEVQSGCPANTGACTSAVPAAVETAKWTPTCAASTTLGMGCYPAAVNYTPTYFLVNGTSFDRTSTLSSAAPVPAAASTGNVLLRLVNAGLRMHVPSVSGLSMSLIAEDGNVVQDVALQAAKGGSSAYTYNARIQSEVFLPASKAYDVLVNPSVTMGSYTPGQFVVFDRQLSLSGNGFQHDTGMQAVVLVNSATGAVAPLVQKAVVADSYIIPVGVATFTANVLSNDVGIFNAAEGGTCSASASTPTPSTGPQTFTTSGGRAIVLNPNGSFTLTVGAPLSTPDTFTYCGDGLTAFTATVTLNGAAVGAAPTANPDSYTSSVSTLLKVNAPGVLANDIDPTGYPLTASIGTVQNGLQVTLSKDGGFTAQVQTPPTSGTANYTFQYTAVNSQGSASAPTTVTLTFHAGSGVNVTVQDAQTPSITITDYKWIIEQDLTFQVNPACQQNGPGGAKPAGCGTGPVPTLGTNLHTSYMPVVAAGCTGPQSCERGQTVYDPTTGQHVTAACDGYGNCTPGLTQLPATLPSQVYLPPTDQFGRPAYYYISVLPGDSANAFNTGNTSDPSVSGNCAAKPTATGQVVPSCGHTMGGAPIAPGQASVTVNVEPNPLNTATITAFVFEDDFPLNGEPDTGGGVDTYPSQEAGLEDFQIELWDIAGSVSGDPTGQMTYDMFNEPLTNALVGTVDPLTGLDACPVSNTAGVAVGTIIVCPKFESDGVTQSPLTGQVVVRNLMPGLFDVVAHPGAAREARGEEWIQTNTLDGTHFQEAFIKVHEPAYFQEYGPGGYHVFFGEANPAIINKRLAAMCGSAGAPACNNTVNVQVANLHQGRSPDERLWTSNVFPQGDGRNYSPLSYTNCYGALGDTDGVTFSFQKCDPNGNLTFSNIPDGNWGLVVLDQWDDLIVDGSSRSVNVKGGQTLNMTYGSFTWQTHLWTKTYLDLNGNGIQDPGEPGLSQVPARVRMRNGKFNNTLFGDINGEAHFDETFPLFNWYVTESDTTRFKATGVHVVNDAGGQLDGPAPNGNGNGGPYQAILNSTETFPLPPSLRIPGAVYCGKADCSDVNLSTNPTGGGPGGSTGRIDPGTVLSEGWQGGLSQFDIIEWGKQPYAAGENGGIRGHVVYNSTRPFDDPGILFQNLWEPLVPNVSVNLYQESVAPDGTTSMKLVDTTTTSSWDAWAQGFRADGVTPNMSCPGEDSADPFFSYTLAGTPNYLNPNVTIPYNSQYKCFDGYHNLSQIQPAPYDGMYQFPSSTCMTPGTTFSVAGNPTLYKCATVANPAAGSVGSAPAVLPTGKYVVEVVPPSGYEIVKEEDKNILIGDAFIAPATLQFGAIGNIFIVPDQASISSYNSCYGTGGGCTNPTTDMGRTDNTGFGPGGLITMSAPCVGKVRIVPDFMSISPESGQVAPFAGAARPLCDRKEVTLEDQMQAQTDFFIWTKTPAASHYTGFVTDDFSSEYDPTNPSFGEKFAIPNLPISIRDYNGVEISRVYSDQWGTFNGLVFSTWEVNPPNPTGYAPQVMVMCMNDPGPVPDPAHPGQTMTDPYFNPNYSDFCYEWSFMPADTAYLDTPVVPTTAFADAYNPPDCAYPDTTPAIKSVVSSDIPGPWVSASGPGHTLTIAALGDQQVLNPAYSGPAATQPPYNQKFIARHYGFGARPSACPATGSCPNVTIGGIAMTNVSWSDATITGTVPSIPSSASTCSIQQENVPPGTSPARCGELIITTASGKVSIDTVTVTVGGKKPTVLPSASTIQAAIDAAAPGDMIIVPPGTYTEMLLMWKPVRLQGVGAASVTVNANTHPAGKLLDPWRRKVNCLFGLALDGGFIDNSPNNRGQATHPYDPSGTYSCNFYNNVTSGPVTTQTLVDPIPLEPVVGWDASLNGNIAELLQEPTLMGAYEGAAITVLAKGLENNNTANCDTLNNAGCVPLNNRTSRGGDCNVASPFYQSNFLCNPSRIDGITFTNSSQGGGGIFLHGWNHYTEVSNNRVYNNSGTLGGGIIVGQAETPPATIDVNGNELPFMLNHHVYVHNNAVTSNTAYGDELNSNTPAASGGVTFCDGSDYYRFNYNWVCGNLSTGDGGGMAHFGFSANGDIEHNAFVFNQSSNPTLTTYGGGLVVEGVGPDGTVCENSATIDMDCPPELSDGVGPGLVINANLFQGNTAESGTGGGLALLHVNGTDVQRNPNNPRNWHSVTVTNNIFANNVAGWAGGGVSLLDAVLVNFVNNTVASNDTTGTAGVLFDTTLAPNANVPPPGCDPTQPNSATNNCTNTAVTQSPFLPAGLETAPHSLLLSSVFTNPGVACPAGHPNCTKFSNPILSNNLFWQNRSFRITTGAIPVPGLQTTVQLVPALFQTATGACPAGANYWDIGVLGDTGPSNHGSTFTLSPQWSLLTDASDYPGSNRGVSPNFTAQYCNGSRVPPEIVSLLCTSNANAPGCIQPGTVGISLTVPPGVPDSTYAGPAFSLNPAATVDEGSNWINMLYGPLSLSNATAYSSSGTALPPLGNYAPQPGSPAIDAVPRGSSGFSMAPSTDFFGNPRPDLANRNAVDVGAVEYQGVQTGAAALYVEPTSLSFGNVFVHSTSAAQTFTLYNNGGATATNISAVVGAPFTRSGGSCGTTLAVAGSCTMNIVFSPAAPGVAAGSVTLTANVPVNGSPVTLSGTGARLSVLPSALTFLTFGPGLSTVQNVTVTNHWTAATGPISAAISGSSSGDFIISAATCGATLAPGASCTISVRFHSPTATFVTANTATLTVTDTDSTGSEASTVSLTGYRLF